MLGGGGGALSVLLAQDSLRQAGHILPAGCGNGNAKAFGQLNKV